MFPTVTTFPNLWTAHKCPERVMHFLYLPQTASLAVLSFTVPEYSSPRKSENPDCVSVHVAANDIKSTRADKRAPSFVAQESFTLVARRSSICFIALFATNGAWSGVLKEVQHRRILRKRKHNFIMGFVYIFHSNVSLTTLATRM